MIPGLEFALAYLVFPGLVFAFVIGLLYEGIDRKVAAHLQNRIGPPVWQPFYDVGKLLSKEDITPRLAQSWLFTLAPLLAFGSILTVMVMLPVNSATPAFTSTASLIVVIYLLNIPAIALMLGGASSSTPFGTVGAERYLVQLFGYEFAFIVAALTAAAYVPNGLSLENIVTFQSSNGWLLWHLPLAGIAALLVAPGKLLKTPFDIPEAEQEIVHGPLTEYSGPKLAIFNISLDIEILAVAGLITALFLGGPASFVIGGVHIPGVVGFILKCLGVVLMITLIRCVTARFRIHQALTFYWVFVAVIALVNLGWVVIV